MQLVQCPEHITEQKIYMTDFFKVRTCAIITIMISAV